MKHLLIAFTLLLSSYSYSNFVYESNQSLIDLRNESSVTTLSSGNDRSFDDQTSVMFNIGFNFTFYGETFTQARMATNGCLHFLANDTTCNDYTPDPLPYATYTMYPFWTDLIGGTMKAKTYNDKTVFGWYDKKEYNRTSSNSFEVILYPNSSFEYRYGELDVNSHDVLIGHQGSVLETYTYAFHDECSTGSTNAANCSSLDWNAHFNNGILENNGSLYSDEVASGGYVDPCIEDVLYSTYCSGYWEAYDDLECSQDAQYAPFCAGYRVEQDVGYFTSGEEYAYGYSQENHMGYTEPLDIFYNDVYTREEEHDNYRPYDYNEPQEFFQPTLFNEPLPFELHPLPEIVPLEEFLQVQTYDEIIIREIREPQEEMFTTFQEFEELFEEERLVEEERIEEEIFPEETYEEENFNNPRPEQEERLVEREELTVEEVFEVRPTGEKSTVRVSALSVVSSTINTAQNSISGTTSGSSIHATGNTVNSGGVSSVGFDSGLNFSNSTDVSGQFNIGSTDTSQSTSVETTVSVSTTNISNEQVETNLDATTVSNDTTSEADQIADEILAKNIAAAQEESIEEQKSTGQYGEEDNIISFINYNPAFNNYRNVVIPKKDDWYAIKSIYIGNSIQDNNLAFYKLSSDSLNGLTRLKELQPNL